MLNYYNCNVMEGKNNKNTEERFTYTSDLGLELIKSDEPDKKEKEDNSKNKDKDNKNE